MKKKKTFLIDILHPAHVHFFKNIVQSLQSQGHEVIITARDKEISIQLLHKYNFPYILLSKQKKGIGLALEMLLRSTKLLFLCLKKRPDLMLGIMGPSIAVVGFLLRIKSWIFYDTENAKITNWFAYPLADTVYTPKCYLDLKRKNETRYPGYHELAYLHPDLFTPDLNIVRKNGIEEDEPYVLIRFVSWEASHDVGEKGLSNEKKIDLVKLVEKYARVYISSEAALPAELAAKSLNASIEDIHHILAHARMVIGESATMASEAAVLGVKAFFISDTKRGYTLEQERDYGLCMNFSNNQFNEVIKQIEEELSSEDSLQKTKQAHTRLLHDKINVTEYMLQQITAKVLN